MRHFAFLEKIRFVSTALLLGTTSTIPFHWSAKRSLRRTGYGRFLLLLAALCSMWQLCGCGAFVVLTKSSPTLAVSSTSLAFGNSKLSATATQPLTLTSSGTSAVTVSSVTVNGAAFSISNVALPAILNPGQVLTLQVSFDPAVAGNAKGTIDISSNSSTGSTTTVSLSGTATSPQLTVGVSTLDFGTVTLNSTSTKTLTLTSSGSGPLTVSSIALSGTGFSMSGAVLPATVDPGQSLNIQVSFDPTQTGLASGTINISSNSATDSTATVALTGTGSSALTAQLTLSATNLAFGNVNLNSTLTQTITLTSSGTAPVTVNSATLAGDGFALAGSTLPATLNPGQALSIQVHFHPLAAGAASGTVTISSDSSNNATATVILSGNCTAPQLTLSTNILAYGNVQLNSTLSKTLTLTSSGTADLTVASVTVVGAEFKVSGGSLPVTLAPGQSIILLATFDPTVSGDATGTITVSSNSYNASSTTVTLSGTGAAAAAPQLTLSASALAFGNVLLNTTSTQTLTLTSSGTTAVTVNSVATAGLGFATSGATFPVTLNPGQSISLQVSFDPTAPGPAAGSITISSNSSSGSVATVTLSGAGTAPQLTLSASTLAFGGVNLNATSTQALTLTSSGTAPVTINSATLTGSEFTMTGGTFPTTLNTGQTMSLQVSFDPTVTGAATGTITISTNSSSGSPVAVALSGTGISAQLSVSAGSLAFGNVNLNTTSTQTLALTPSGNAPVTVNSATLTGSGFTMTGGTFPTTLNPGQTMSLQVSFDPTVAGAASGAITITSNSSSGGPITVALSGTGISAQLSVSAGSLAFGNVNLNTTSTQTLTLTPSGNAPVTVNSATLTGSEFTMTGGTFPTTLNPGQTLSLQVSFDPTVAGAASGTITISSSPSSGGPITVALSGTGTSAQLSVSAGSLAFGNVNLNTTSTQTLTLTSSGTAPLTVKSATLTGSGFTMTGGTFPTTLNPGQTLSLQVSFDPTVAGAASGTITISSNSSSGTTVIVGLAGTGINAGNPVLTLSATSLNFGDDPIGKPVTLQLTLSSTGTSPVTVSSATIAGAGFTFTGATFPLTLNPTVAVSIQVQFDPAIAGAANGTLTFTSNSSNGGSVVNLTGTGTPVQHQVTLNWTAPANSPVTVTGFNVYRASGANSPFQLVQPSNVSQTTFIDPNVLTGATYIYYVTSLDAAGTESAPSNEVTVTIP